MIGETGEIFHDVEVLGITADEPEEWQTAIIHDWGVQLRDGGNMDDVQERLVPWRGIAQIDVNHGDN